MTIKTCSRGSETSKIGFSDRDFGIYGLLGHSVTITVPNVKYDYWYLSNVLKVT